MEVVKLGKKGQVSIPRRLLRELGVEGEAMMIVEKTDEGGLLLKPAGIFPIETYSIERISEFLATRPGSLSRMRWPSWSAMSGRCPEISRE